MHKFIYKYQADSMYVSAVTCADRVNIHAGTAVRSPVPLAETL